MIKITECPRDAMQGIKSFIPTEKKIHYLNLLLKVGFDRLDFGSFVSPKYTPQLQDTAEVVDKLNLEGVATQLLAIIANRKGAEAAVSFDQIKILGFPLSLSETFQQRNTNSSIQEAFQRVEEISNLCFNRNKTPLIYLSMGFGNPYGDPWHAELIVEFIQKLQEMGIQEIRLSDTTGESTPENIRAIFPVLKQEFPTINLGLHLHSRKEETTEKLLAALESGCQQFDSAIGGFGGCQMASDTLTGNIATEVLLQLIAPTSPPIEFNQEAWNASLLYNHELFNTYF